MSPDPALLDLFSRRHVYCPRCAFDLFELPTTTCPECGRVFTRRDLRVARARRGFHQFTCVVLVFILVWYTLLLIPWLANLVMSVTYLRLPRLNTRGAAFSLTLACLYLLILTLFFWMARHPRAFFRRTRTWTINASEAFFYPLLLFIALFLLPLLLGLLR